MIDRSHTQQLNPAVRLQTLDPCVAAQRGDPGACPLALALPHLIRSIQLQNACQVLALGSSLVASECTLLLDRCLALPYPCNTLSCEVAAYATTAMGLSDGDTHRQVR